MKIGVLALQGGFAEHQAVLDRLVIDTSSEDSPQKKGAVLAAITALKQICNHPEAYRPTGEPDAAYDTYKELL